MTQVLGTILFRINGLSMTQVLGTMFFFLMTQVLGTMFFLLMTQVLGTMFFSLLMTQVLGTMFAIFVVCWAPFFCVNFAMGLCGSQCAIDDRLFKVLVWLGYGSSTVNPIVYTIFNKTFKQTFCDLLTCRRWTGHARIDKKALLYQHHNGNHANQKETLL